MTSTDALPTWRDGASKQAILGFIEQVVASGLPTEQRIATFDADGTLWCEQPIPVQLDFILRRLAEQATSDQTLRDRQPWKAAYEKDMGWLAAGVKEHYAGDDTKAKLLLAGVSAAFAGVEVEQFEALSGAFLRGTDHPTLGRGYTRTAYKPMLELLRYLETNGFTTLIVSGSGGDFMRSIAQEVFGIPPERVIGSASALEYASTEQGGAITHKGALAFLDDGAQKPIEIWNRIGRRPLIAGGNSNGDIPMLQFAGHPDRPCLGLLVNHDDAAREFAYGGAEKAIAEAGTRGWTVVSMKDDFATVFDD